MIIRGRDGAATVSREKVSHTQKIMMGNDGGASCASCVMIVMAMTVIVVVTVLLLAMIVQYARPRRRGPFTGPLEKTFFPASWDHKTVFLGGVNPTHNRSTPRGAHNST